MKESMWYLEVLVKCTFRGLGGLMAVMFVSLVGWTLMRLSAPHPNDVVPPGRLIFYLTGGVLMLGLSYSMKKKWAPWAFIGFYLFMLVLPLANGQPVFVLPLVVFAPSLLWAILKLPFVARKL